MFTFILISLILLPVASLPLALTLFSSAELDEMGIHLENINETFCEEPSLPSDPITIQMRVVCGNS